MTTRVYEYGLLPPTSDPAPIWAQLQAAHRYRLRLTEIEQARRASVAAVEAADSGVRAATAAVAALVVDADRAARRSAEVALRQARASARVIHAPEIARLTEASRAACREARATCGAYWGTYLLVEAAMDAARRAPDAPRFPAWRGEGRIGVQCQGGLSVADWPTDRRCQLVATPHPVPGRGGRPRPRVRLRIGSTADRDPVWAEWPVILHRPLPTEARILWAVVQVAQEAGRPRWTLRVTVRLPEVVPPVSEGRVVLVDLGWARQGDSRRAGTWTDDGVVLHDVEVPVPVLAALDRASSLQSIRDRHLVAVRAQIVAWRDAYGALPEDHRQRVRVAGTWQSPRRVAALRRWWRDHRIDGDAGLWSGLEAWHRQDAHLWRWQVHGRATALRRRREAYRVLAADLATRYDTLVIERLDLRALARATDPRPPAHQARAQRVETAPSVLRQACVQAFGARGKAVLTIAPGTVTSSWARWCERSGVERLPGGAREAKFARIRREKAARSARGEAAVDG